MRRVNLENLTVTRITTYQKPAWHKEGLTTVWRYAFKDDEGKSYVYSGRSISAREREVLSLRASIKCERDSYGFCRLSRPVIVERGRKNSLYEPYRDASSREGG